MGTKERIDGLETRIKTIEARLNNIRESEIPQRRAYKIWAWVKRNQAILLVKPELAFDRQLHEEMSYL